MMGGEYNHFVYGQMLAEGLLAIGHSGDRCRYYTSVETDTLGEMNERLSEAMGTILIAHDAVQSSYSWKRSDNLMRVRQYEFMVLVQAELGDVGSVRGALARAEDVAGDIVRRMVRDAEEYRCGLEYLDMDGMGIEPIGPVRENFFGVSLTFGISRGVDVRLRAGKWKG